MTEAFISCTTSTSAVAGVKPEQASTLPSADGIDYLDRFRESIDSQFEIDKVYSLTLTRSRAAEDLPSTCEPIPTSPLLLSPASSISSPLSEQEDPWDSPQSPQTPSQQKSRAYSDLTTPLTPPDTFDGTIKDEAAMAELADTTPSRTGVSSVGLSMQDTQGGEVFLPGIRNFQTLLQSSTNSVVGSSWSRSKDSLPSQNPDGDVFEARPGLSDQSSNSLLDTDSHEPSPKIKEESDLTTVLSPHSLLDTPVQGPSSVVKKESESITMVSEQSRPRVKRSEQIPLSLAEVKLALQPSDKKRESIFATIERRAAADKIALRVSDGHENEDIFSAMGRRAKEGPSDANTFAPKAGAATLNTSLPSQSSPEPPLTFKNTAPTEFVNPFAFGKDGSRDFSFGVPHVGQQRPETQALKQEVETKPHRTGPVPKVTAEAPHGCKQYWWLLDEILPFTINQRLVEDPNRCVATGPRTKRRCSRKAHIPLDTTRTAMDAFRDYMETSDCSEFFGHIERLVKMVMCSLHQKAVLRTDTASPRMERLRNLTSTYSKRRRDVTKILEDWLEAISDTHNPTAHVSMEPSIPVPPQSSSPAPSHAKKSDKCDTAKALEATASNLLSKADQKDGFIYMFWDQKNFGMIKIGRTNNLKRRLREWNAQCKITHYYHRSSEDGGPLKIPHCQRIEKLMHIELDVYRKKRVCEGCGKTHIEWFDISAERAKKVYQKWEKWIRQKPYAENDEGKWVLKPEMADTLSQVCTPVVFLDPIVIRRPRPSPPKTRSKRRISGAVR